MPDQGFYREDFASAARRAMAGQAVAGEYRFCFGGIMGDRKGFVEMSVCDQSGIWYRCLSLCEMCRAEKPSNRRTAQPDLNYGDFSRAAGWRKTRVSDEEYCATHARTVSPWVSGVGSRHLLLTWEDFVHNTYFGHARDALGSAVAEMCSWTRKLKAW